MNLNLLIEDCLSLPGTAVQSIILWLLKFASSLLSGQNLLFESVYFSDLTLLSATAVTLAWFGKATSNDIRFYRWILFNKEAEGGYCCWRTFFQSSQR